MSWDVGFPVNFTENGDKTRNAIQKHINEFLKVYTHLNSLASNSGGAITSTAANPLKIFVAPGADEMGFRTAEYKGNNPPAPNAETGKTPLWVLHGIGGSQWWNVLTYGVEPRLCQIAIQALPPHGGRVFVRSQSEGAWGSWLEIQTGVGIPKGLVAMWSGAVSEIPAGWALCDGKDGRPNLLGKFVRGVPNALTNPGETGGSDEVRLTVEQMPEHTHTTQNMKTAEDGEHYHGIFSHPYSGGAYGNYSFKGEALNASSSQPASQQSNAYVSPYWSAHEHKITGSIDEAGGGHPFDNRPAYYELAYIVKL